MAIQILSNLNYPIGNIINQELQNANSVKIAGYGDDSITSSQIGAGKVFGGQFWSVLV